MENLNFQYCQKLVVLDDKGAVLLARRRGEADYDDVYSLIGGKMEHRDGSLLEGIRREKIEEIGRRAILLVAPHVSYNVYYKKKDGKGMILPHIYAKYTGGPIDLSNEYSDYQWVPSNRLGSFEPKIETIPEAVKWARRIKRITPDDQLIEI